MAAPAAPAGAGTLFQGCLPDGSNYSPGTIRNLFIADLAHEAFGWESAAVDRLIAADLVLSELSFCPYNVLATGPSYSPSIGDSYIYPQVFSFAQPQFWYILASMVADATVKGYANWVVQQYSQYNADIPAYVAPANTPTKDTFDLCLRDPSAATVNVSGITSRVRFAGGMGNFASYKNAPGGNPGTWVFFRCGNLSDGADHEGYNQGDLQIYRGPDDGIMWPVAFTAGEDQGNTPNYSRFSNSVLLDDFGAGTMLYPSTLTGGGLWTPGQGTDYTGPSASLEMSGGGVPARTATATPRVITPSPTSRLTW